MNTKGSILKEVNKIKYDSIEHVLVFNQEGKLLTKSTGKKDEVFLSGDDIDKLPESITIHNHPQGTTFSLIDIITTLSCRIREAQVVTSHNITYVLETIDKTIYEYIEYDIIDSEYTRLYNLYHDDMILGQPKKKHVENYQKLFSRIMTDLFQNIDSINYYEVGKYTP